MENHSVLLGGYGQIGEILLANIGVDLTRDITLMDMQQGSFLRNDSSDSHLISPRISFL